MKALVVYESMWGNTAEVAGAIAAGISQTQDVDIVDVSDRPSTVIDDVSLLVVGGPTHAFSMSRSSSRADAHTRGAAHGGERFGLREWLAQLPQGRRDQVVATFDTKVRKARHLPGAARSAARAMAKHGFRRASHTESFYVEDMDGPLAHGELERARQWGRDMAGTATIKRTPVGGDG